MVKVAVSKNDKRAKAGNSQINLSAISPKSGGIIIMPVLQATIQNPTIDGETSAPKLLGVACIRLGKVGPIPKPTRTIKIPLTIGGTGVNKPTSATPITV